EDGRLVALERPEPVRRVIGHGLPVAGGSEPFETLLLGDLAGRGLRRRAIRYPGRQRVDRAPGGVHGFAGDDPGAGYRVVHLKSAYGSAGGGCVDAAEVLCRDDHFEAYRGGEVGPDHRGHDDLSGYEDRERDGHRGYGPADQQAGGGAEREGEGRVP